MGIAYVCVHMYAAFFEAASLDGIVSLALLPLETDGTCTSLRGELMSSRGVQRIFLCAMEKEVYVLGKTLSPFLQRLVCLVSKNFFINTAIEYLRLFNSSFQGQRIFFFFSFFFD